MQETRSTYMPRSPVPPVICEGRVRTGFVDPHGKKAPWRADFSGHEKYGQGLARPLALQFATTEILILNGWPKAWAGRPSSTPRTGTRNMVHPGPRATTRGCQPQLVQPSVVPQVLGPKLGKT